MRVEHEPEAAVAEGATGTAESVGRALVSEAAEAVNSEPKSVMWYFVFFVGSNKSLEWKQQHVFGDWGVRGHGKETTKSAVKDTAVRYL
ncbi:hypothetical protein ERJ75_000176900 [Trypanosoma vivax]|nr:hypothetical protein ERJ75_000176900 [Trypanosoma vivax]